MPCVWSAGPQGSATQRTPGIARIPPQGNHARRPSLCQATSQRGDLSWLSTVFPQLSPPLDEMMSPCMPSMSVSRRCEAAGSLRCWHWMEAIRLGCWLAEHDVKELVHLMGSGRSALPDYMGIAVEWCRPKALQGNTSLHDSAALAAPHGQVSDRECGTA